MVSLSGGPSANLSVPSLVSIVSGVKMAGGISRGHLCFAGRGRLVVGPSIGGQPGLAYQRSDVRFRPRIASHRPESFEFALCSAPPSPTPPSPTSTGQFPAWVPNHAYATGALVSYAGHNYRCLQAHTSLVGWEPPNVPALWQLVS